MTGASSCKLLFKVQARTIEVEVREGKETNKFIVDRDFPFLLREWKAADGTNVNAALGFLNFISRLVPDRKPSRLFVALDADWRPRFRVEILPSYKSQRVAGPDDPPDPV